MKTKDEWVSKAQVARECAKCVLEGEAPELINGSMIAGRLNTKGRHTVYRFVAEWKAEQEQRADLPDFVLTEDACENLGTPNNPGVIGPKVIHCA